ncbi:hypothetical protein J2T14_005330 [Paenibacillus harenae]|nr:hypothetical protein [Paenibacillus harenae]
MFDEFDPDGHMICHIEVAPIEQKELTLIE